MLKYLSLGNLEYNMNFDETEYERLYELFQTKNDKFKSNGNEYILFYEKDFDYIKSYLKLDIDKVYLKDISEYFEAIFDFYDIATIGNYKIKICDCIQLVLDNIEQYEDRIFNSEVYENEVKNIVKEQTIKIFEKDMEEYKKILVSGNFKFK